MALTLVQQTQKANETDFLMRVQAALLGVCKTVFTEGAVNNHAARLAWAIKVSNNPASYARIVAGFLANNVSPAGADYTDGEITGFFTAAVIDILANIG